MDDSAVSKIISQRFPKEAEGVVESTRIGNSSVIAGYILSGNVYSPVGDLIGFVDGHHAFARYGLVNVHLGKTFYRGR